VAERPIVLYGDPVLRETSEPVDEINQEVKDLVSDMVDTIKKAKGLGLAAVQIGVPKRIFLVDLSAVDLNETLRVYINPEIVETEGEVTYEEGCLSFPGIYQKVDRPAKVTIRATDLEGNRFEQTADGIAARAILHEFDHLEGKLFIDYLSSITRSLLKGRLKKLATAS
jgi:peptide deformylase